MTTPADESRPLEEQLPPAVVATPQDVRHAPDETPRDICWWRPGWGDVLRGVGWRWVLLTPALGLVGLWAASWYVPASDVFVLQLLSLKLLLFVIGVAASLAGYVIRRAVKSRSEPFCIYCGYSLVGLPDDYRCPECGRPYTWRLIAEYRRDPHWFIERWRAQHDLPAAATPFVAGRVRRKRRRDGT